MKYKISKEELKERIERLPKKDVKMINDISALILEIIDNFEHQLKVKDEEITELNNRTCENCKYGSNSSIAVDGLDIRMSQYPSMIVCKFFTELKESTFGCNKFERKE